MKTRFFDEIQRLDEILKRGPRTCNFLEDVKPLLSEEAARKYFYQELEDPAWLRTLSAAGEFADVPEPIRDPEKRSTAFPQWHVSRFLVRAAGKEPRSVMQEILQIRETDNVQVHEDLAEATFIACAEEPELAAKWAEKEADWLRKQKHLYFALPETLAKLITELARAGQVDPALRLARALLDLRPAERYPSPDEDDEVLSLPGRPQPRFDSWYYEQILTKQIPQLLKAAPQETLILLCDLLEKAVRLSRSPVEDEKPEDFAYIGPPAIEGHEQNRLPDLTDHLAFSLRDAAEARIPDDKEKVLELIEARPFNVFKRIGIHLRRCFPDIDPEGTVKLVTDPKVFNDPFVHHEFYHLLRELYGSLPRETQEKYLRMVEQECDVEKWLEYREKESGQRPSPTEAAKYARLWQYRRLLPIESYLDGDWQRRFQKLREEFGPLAHPDFLRYISTTWVGPTSPQTLEEISSMTVEEIVAFLRTWEPPGGYREPTPEGLGRALSVAVSKEPDRFAAQAEQFRGLDPTYVRCFLWGLGDAAKNNLVFTWQPVLNLCKWVLEQPREIPGRRSEYSDLDPGWVWTRKEIGSLLSNGFREGRAEIPFDLRTEVWEVLRPITDDPEPTPERERREDGIMANPADLSINTTRGQAMQALIGYARWVRQHLAKTADGKKQSATSFAEMPEVRNVLDLHLDPGIDPSLAIRSVYGQWLNALLYLDLNWVSENLERIFPHGEEQRDLLLAAWETHITFSNPTTHGFQLLREEYRRAIERIGTLPKERTRLADPDERLAEHLMVLYWWGELRFDENGLLARFYQNTSPRLRQHAFKFVGRQLKDWPGEVPKDVLARLKGLCGSRIEAVCKAKRCVEEAVELTPFGWWFASGKFEDSWAVQQLKRVLEISRSIEPSHLVVERLASIVKVSPLIAVECLDLIVAAEKQGWGVHIWQEHAREVLSVAIESSDEAARESAVDVVHRLGSRGFLEFRDLLP